MLLKKMLLGLSPLFLHGRKLLDVRMYRIQCKSNGTMGRYKACLVILGNTQVEGEDVTETFAPAAKLVSACTLLVVAVAKG